MPLSPYDQLYIYEIDGDARAGASGLSHNFLGLWLEGESSFLFFSQPADGPVDRIVEKQPSLKLRQVHHLSYDEWQGGLDLEPLEMDGLTVVPFWQDYTPPAQRKDIPLIQLDPGLVFGSGLHPTTRHCLGMLLARAARGPLGGVVDLGCGSGILALAAAKLGAAPVLAVDLNPLCVQTTERNATLNRLALKTVEAPALDYLNRPAEVLLANLPWEVMKDLLEDPAPLAGKRDLILSGITRSWVGLLHRALDRLGYAVEQEHQAEQTWFSVWAVNLDA